MIEPPQPGRRVALLGNMNNVNFALVRYLRDRGVEAELFSFAHEPTHFRPSADSYDLSHRSFCHEVAWGEPADWSSLPRDEIRTRLHGYDVLVGCGLAPAYCHEVGRRLDVFLPYGADLADLTRFGLRRPDRALAIWRAIAAQRAGIGAARVLHMDDANELYESLVRRFAGGAERWLFGPPMVHTGTYAPDRMEGHRARTHWGHLFGEVRSQCELLILSHGRHVWGGATADPNQKGTDRLLHGVAEFRRRRPGVEVRLVTLEYGADVARSRSLIQTLGLEEVVVWFPQMLRKDVMVAVHDADVVCAEFHHSWLSSGVIYEAQALAKPVLGYRDDVLHARAVPELYPMLNARSPGEIADRLEQAAADPEGVRTIGETGRDWYGRHVVDRAVGQYQAHLGRPG